MALDDLIRYESAAVAAMNVEKEKDLAVFAMENQYKTILGKDFDTDPIIRKSLEEAMVGGKQNITNSGIVQAMSIYSGKYEKSFNSTKFSDLIKYLTEGYKVSNEVKEALGKYGELTLKELADKGKEEGISEEEMQEIAKAIQAVTLLKTRILRARTLDIYNGVVKRNLEGLYPKKEESE